MLKVSYFSEPVTALLWAADRVGLLGWVVQLP
jgi:hypothetical protein